MAQALKADRDCAIASAEGHEEVHPQPGKGRQLGRAGRAIRQFGEARFRFRQRAGEELAFGPIELEREGEIMTALPRVARQQGRAGDEVGQRRGVGGRGLGAPARNQVQLGEPLALVARADERGPAIELADDLEDALIDARLAGSARRAAARWRGAPPPALPSGIRA